jgi:DNA-binding transcriptional MerR regulator
MAEKLFSIKQIAEALDIGESTIRYWRDRYKDFIPFIGYGRRTRYPVEALEVFKFIVERSLQGMRGIEIKEELEDNFKKIDYIPNKAYKAKAVLQELRKREETSDDNYFREILTYLERITVAQERTAIVLERMAENEMQPPYPTLFPNAQKDKLRNRIKKMRNLGMTYRKIAGILNKEGVPTSSGKGVWNGSAVSRLLK